MGGSSGLKAEDDTPPELLPAARVARRVVRVREMLAAVGVVLGEKKGGVEEELAALVEDARRSLSEVVVALLGAVDVRKKSKSGDTGNKRGAKRRRTSSQYSCTKVTSTTLDDGHTWRKYGQKQIQNAKHPRSYYRCTHKPDRGCQAQRQSQLCESDSTTYIITYFGEHTCQNPQHTAAAAHCKPHIITFGAEEPPQSTHSSSSPFPKQEPDLDALSGVSHEDHDGSTLQSGHGGAAAAVAASLAPTDAATQASEAASEQGDVTSEADSSMEFTIDGFFGYDGDADVFTGLDGELEGVLSSWPFFDM